MKYYYVTENAINGVETDSYVCEWDLLDRLQMCEDFELVQPVPAEGYCLYKSHRETYEHNEYISWRISDLSSAEEKQRLALVESAAKYHKFSPEYWIPYRLPEGNIGLSDLVNRNPVLEYTLFFQGVQLIFESFCNQWDHEKSDWVWGLYEKAINGVYVIDPYEK